MRILKTISLIFLPICIFFLIGYIMGFFYPDVPRSSFYNYFLYMSPSLLFGGLIFGGSYFFLGKK